MNFNLDKIEANKEVTHDMVIGHRADGAPVGFRLRGMASDAYQEASRQVDLLNIKRAAGRKDRLDMSTDEGAAAAVDESAHRRDLLLKACVVDWFGFTIGEDEPAPFTEDNFMRALRLKPQLRMAILAEVENEENFTMG